MNGGTKACSQAGWETDRQRKQADRYRPTQVTKLWCVSCGGVRAGAVKEQRSGRRCGELWAYWAAKLDQLVGADSQWFDEPCSPTSGQPDNRDRVNRELMSEAAGRG